VFCEAQDNENTLQSRGIRKRFYPAACLLYCPCVKRGVAQLIRRGVKKGGMGILSLNTLRTDPQRILVDCGDTCVTR
jgi:hypothetical protein